MSAPSGEERTLGEAAQVERAAWCCGQRNRNTPHSRTLTTGKTGSIPRAPRYFGPAPKTLLIGVCICLPWGRGAIS
eukprot:scaffold142991_cov130-Phaeocystis_antarctica.AAC.1